MAEMIKGKSIKEVADMLGVKEPTEEDIAKVVEAHSFLQPKVAEVAEA